MKRNTLIKYGGLVIMALILSFCTTKTPTFKAEYPFQDPTVELEERVADLISRLTLEEKIMQMHYESPAIPRLGIPEYNWWNECLHGIARAGKATVFPQAIALGATFDPELMKRLGEVISTEGRAKHNAGKAIGNRGQYMGLTYWTPNINIFRDPRWGRGQETYGEDPFLTGELGKAFVKGLQGDDPRYLKAAACAKHYVVHSGPEADRHVFDAVPPLKDFQETYLPAFRELVVNAGVAGVMCAYNRTYGEACCGSSYLLQDILRHDWGFKGYITSDCWALIDFHEHHKITADGYESAALGLNSGVNLNCGVVYRDYLHDAVKKGLVEESTIDKVLTDLLRIRFQLGLFDPEGSVPFDKIGPEKLNCAEHQALAKEAATKSIVLLKNKNNLLPLDKNMKHLAVVGHHAASVDILIGNYYGVSGNKVTILEGITNAVNPGTRVEYRYGSLISQDSKNPMNYAIGEAKGAEVSILVMGISGLLEGEEGESVLSDTKGDRFDLDLPKPQVDFIKSIREGNDKPIILVLTGGSPIALGEVEDLVDAILFVWYPGEEGGNAVADILFGNASPSGRLPITFPKSVDQLPPYEEYSMVGRTYRYMKEDPLYPFGFGLSYTRFAYSELVLDKKQAKEGETVTASVKVTNTGSIAGSEVVQMYLSDLEASARVPLQSLKGIQRVDLKPGESKVLNFVVGPEMMMMITEKGESILEPGDFEVIIAGAAPVKRSLELGAAEPVKAVFTLTK